MMYRVPDNVCIKGGTLMGADAHDSSKGKGEAFLPCGVTTALFDEVRGGGRGGDVTLNQISHMSKK